MNQILFFSETVGWKQKAKIKQNDDRYTNDEGRLPEIEMASYLYFASITQV